MPLRLKKNLFPVNMGERHIASVLLVDNSGSMSGSPIRELNEGLAAFGQALREDSLALGRADVTVISFNSGINTELEFQPAEQYEAPMLSASGMTALNEAIIEGLDAIEARKNEYKAAGISYFRPWLFLMTDGAPTDLEKEGEAKSRLRFAIEQKKVVYMPMGIGAANLSKLQEYYPENYEDDKGNPLPKVVLKADVDNFKDAFIWLSNSIEFVSKSNPELGQVQLPPVPNHIVVDI